MDKNNLWRKTKDIEIDLADFFKAVCMKWKQAFACAILFAVLFGAYGYLKAERSVPLPATEAAGEIELSEEERQAVDTAVQLQSETSSLEEYLDHSILMQVDPYHKNKAVLLYSIEHADRRDLQKITESYISFVENGGAVAALKQFRKKWGIESSYLAELFNAVPKYYSQPYQVAVDSTAMDGLQSETVFCIEIAGRDAEMAGSLALDMQEALNEYSKKAGKQAGSHKLTLISVEKGIESDAGLQSQQHDKRQQLQSYTANLKAVTDSFNNGQMGVYLESTGAESQDTAEEKAVEAQSARVSMKYILAGLAGGIFIYACIFACQYVLHDTVKSEKQLKELYTFPVYGSLFLKKKKGLPFTQRADASQSRAKLLERIKLVCRKRGITKLCLVSSVPFSSREKECLEGIGKQFMSWGIEISNLARLRNGVETIPANIRKNYHLDKLPRGKQRGKFFFGSKIAALNFRKLFGFRKGLGNYAQNPVLA